MLYTLKKYPLPEDLSIPIQIQSLQEKAIEVIDYDYIGDAKEENYISFANQFYGFLSKWGIKDIAIITYSKAMRDTPLFLERPFALILIHTNLKMKLQYLTFR